MDMKTITARDHLLQAADLCLQAGCHAVAIWDIPGFYYDAAGHTAAKQQMEADAQAAYTTALAYRMTGNPAYADKAGELLNGWAALNKQIAGHDGPLVSAYLGVGLIQAALLIKSYPGWSADEQAAFANWLNQVCLPDWDRIPIRNNWWNWSLFAQLALYHFMGDKLRFAEEVANLKDHIDSSLSDEGFIPEEAERGKNSIWYHYFALAPTTAAAKLILDATGEDLFHWISPGGKSIKAALDRLFYYADGRIGEWPYDEGQAFPAPLSGSVWPVDLFEAMFHIYGEPEYERFVAPYRPVSGGINKNTGHYHSHAWIYPALHFPERY